MVSRADRYPGWVPYVTPYALFLLVTWLGSEIPGASYLAFPVRTAIVAAAVGWFWREGCYPEMDLRPSLTGIGAGLLGYAMWVYPEDWLAWLPKLGESTFDPDGAGPGWRTPLLSLRLATATLLVPVFEELFLRSFLVRYLDAIREDRDDFREIPLARFRWFSFVGVVVAMAITHHRWLRGGLYSALMLGLLYREKRMGPVFWAHAVTNLCMCLYVFETGRWEFL